MPQLDTQLAVGVHPLDSSTNPATYANENPAPDSVAKPHTKSKPWGVRNEEALPVYQRAAHKFTAVTYTVSGAMQILPSQDGRLKATLYVSSTAADGVVIGPDRGQIEVGYGAVLNPGDSIDLPTEAAIYAAPIGTNATGTVTIVSFFNPPKVD